MILSFLGLATSPTLYFVVVHVLTVSFYFQHCYGHTSEFVKMLKHCKIVGNIIAARGADELMFQDRSFFSECRVVGCFAESLFHH